MTQTNSNSLSLAEGALTAMSTATLQTRLPRRDILKSALGGMTAMGLTSFGLSACGGGDDAAAVPATAANVTGVTFTSTAAPTAVADRATTFTASSVLATYSDGSSKTQSLAYNTLFKTGDALTRPDGGSVIAGGYYYPDGVTPIIDITGTSPVQYFSDCPDGTTLIKLATPTVSGISGNTVFMVTQFEYASANNAQGEARPVLTANSMYGRLPSPIAVVTLDQNKTTGALTTKHYYTIPSTNVHGLWITCAASLSPWNTHLSSEEYEPDAWKLAPANLTTNAADSGVLQFQAFSTNTFGSATTAKPYHYGHVPEVTVNPDGTGSMKKHYCMGRISRELVQVMPDQRTVLMGDDATSGGIYMFIADVAGVLSSGTLYVAQVTNTTLPTGSAAGGGAFNLAWVKLGHANSIEIEALANTLAATDIMAVNTGVADPVNGSVRINYGNGQQWVKFTAGQAKAAAFLETHRYAAVMGGTMEFSKFEGVTVNVADKKAYFAMAAIRDTMTANGFVSDVIQLTRVSAGGVYEVTLAGGKTDTDAGAIDSVWVPTTMSVPTHLLGQDMTADADGNTAVVDKIANPDNAKFSEASRTLFIGEDSGQHLNNYVWAYNVDTPAVAPKRILSAPAGAECVCLEPVDNLNGFAYLVSGFQHPGDWVFTVGQAALNTAINTNWGNKKKAAIGYLSGIPKIG
jgi:secreted PhoX family phosphatase